jgi:ABC-type branched-subunit amino acid transport system substrate-binding protein
MGQLRVLALAPSLLIAAFLIAGCTSAPSRPPLTPSSGEPRAEPKPQLPGGIDQAGTKPDKPKPSKEDLARAQADGLTPPHMINRDITRAAVLLPFSHPNRRVREEAQGLLAGIEMALFELAEDDFLIIPKDTSGTVSGAEAAARTGLEQGADVILGPLFSQNVRAVTPLALKENAPVIAFSNDPTAAGGGAYLASFTVEEEVARVVEYAAFQGVEAFAFLGPDSSYGQRVERSLRFEAVRQGGYVLSSQFYDPSNAAPVDEAEALAQILAPMVEDNPGRIGVIIPESGVKLRSVAPLLAYYGVDFRDLRMLGTSQWDDPSIWREPTLNGAWFALPSQERASDFAVRYRRAYGRAPTELASLGYDAAAMAIGLTGRDRLDYGGITNGQGFVGANGLFRFRSDGTPQRALSVMEIDTREGAELVSPPASSFTPPTG